MAGRRQGIGADTAGAGLDEVEMDRLLEIIARPEAALLEHEAGEEGALLHVFTPADRKRTVPRFAL